ncbi:MAG: GspH/FimT family pseudopilin [Alcanivoracaceae bacterium]|nr:GspH/FimT family pseudopilin [Alcanivoracaceae bacterium]
MIHTNRQRGFSFIELMLTVAIFAIIVSIGLPAFNDATANSNLRSATMDMVTTINTARAQAVTLRQEITLRPIDNADWVNGWVLEYPAGSTEEDQQFVPDSRVQITEANGLTNIRFLTSGLVSDPMDFTICDYRAGETGRQLQVSKLARVERTEVACP